MGKTFYKDVWTPSLGEELQCGRAGNIHDLHAVAMNKPGIGIVGHVEREILLLAMYSY